jgi:hypothetical protein
MKHVMIPYRQEDRGDLDGKASSQEGVGLAVQHRNAGRSGLSRTYVFLPIHVHKAASLWPHPIRSSVGFDELLDGKTLVD